MDYGYIMDYEKKYKEALERARDFMEDTPLSAGNVLIKSIFPELTESNDERIRKELLEHIKHCSESIPERAAYITWLEKQGEQKPTDKVEPRFKVGDWVVFNGLTLYVKEVVKGFYRTVSKGGIPNSYDWDIDNVARLWTIQDAKDGDVLVRDIYSDGMSICLFKDFNPQIFTMKLYCSLNKKGQFLPYNDWAYYHRYDVTLCPATKEQCDLLFQKMKEEGYEWDVEKKELNKIEKQSEQIHAEWSEKDEKKFRDVIRLVEQGAPVQLIRDHYTNWLKSLKERYTWKPSEEQLKSLQEVIDEGHFTSYPNAIETLYEQLKKLMEEDV